MVYHRGRCIVCGKLKYHELTSQQVGIETWAGVSVAGEARRGDMLVWKSDGYLATCCREHKPGDAQLRRIELGDQLTKASKL
jgi:hypothetical protein